MKFQVISSVVSAAIIGCVVMGQEERSPNNQAYLLPMDAETILSAPISESFSCEGRGYGYYADVDNNCELYHICLPLEDDLGQIVETAHWTFVCGNTTVFDQATLTCNYPEDSIPCEESESFYNLVPFGEKEAPAFEDTA